MENTEINPPNITVQDLVGLKSAIEVACSRGAYRAEEMQAVGTLFTNLSAFLKAIEPQMQAAEPAPPAPDTAPVETAEPAQGE
jgi:hypothetical protein